MNEMALADAVKLAAARGEVVEAVRGIYTELQQEIERRRPACAISGRCCRFEEYGHRLYVTTIELAAFVAGLDQKPSDQWDGTGCPFQQGKLCGVHRIRPFGCRAFFCDPTADQWQQEQYERFHAKLKAMHGALGVPYYYVEWRAGLRAVLDLPA